MKVRATCPREAGLIELLDGDLPADQFDDWGNHLERCPTCQARFETLALQWTPVLTADRERPSPHLVVARQHLLECGRPGFLANRDAPGAETPPSTTTDPPPDRIGRYSDLQLIGRGGMGIVYRAFDDVLRRVVAIKQLSPHLAASPLARERFVREAQAAAAVVHEHVVAIHSVEEDAGVPFIVMQYIAGENLQERIDREGPLELSKTQRIGVEIANGLAAAHAQGIVHRDIKPSNILLESGLDRVRITDFGLARVAAVAGITREGEALGTPQYMSAEQARGEPVDSRSDLFSLGSVLYAMAAGRPPFEADTVAGTLRLVADLPARPIREVNPVVPSWLAAIIDRLHAKSPDKRYQTADQVAAILLAEHADVPTERMRNGRRWWIGAAAAALGLGAALALGEVTGVTRMLSASSSLALDKTDVRAAAARNQAKRLVTTVETPLPSSKASRSVPEITLPGSPANQTLRSQLRTLDAVLERDPADIKSLLSRAIVHTSLGQRDQAIADYTQLISGPGGDVRYRSVGLGGRAEVYGQRGDWQAAINDYSRYLDECPKPGRIHARLAMILLAGPESLRNPERALELAQIAVQVPNDHAEYRTVLGAALYRVEQFREAAETLESAGEEEGGYTPFNKFFLAMAWHQLGGTRTARLSYEKAIGRQRQAVGNLAERGLIELLREEAEALLEIKSEKN